MSIAEDLCQALSGITFVNDDSLETNSCAADVDIDVELWVASVVVLWRSSLRCFWLFLWWIDILIGHLWCLFLFLVVQSCRDLYV